MRKIAFLFVLGYLALCVKASGMSISEAKVEIDKIVKAYSACKQLTIEACMSSYSRSRDTRPEDSETFKICTKGGLFYLRMDEMEQISNLSYSLTLDHKDKLLVLDRGSDLKIKGDPRKFFGHDKALAGCSSVKGYAVDQDSRGLSFQLKEQQYYSITVEYSTTSYLVEKITIVYNEDGKEGARVCVEYSRMDPKTPVDDQLFSERRFVSMDKAKKFHPRETYKDYKFINHLN